MAGHDDSFGYLFDMVKQIPSILEIPARLHAFNQVDPTTRADLGPLENKNFVRLVTLAWN